MDIYIYIDSDRLLLLINQSINYMSFIPLIFDSILGTLFKQGNQALKKEWKPRWCILKDTALYYYKDQSVIT